MQSWQNKDVLVVSPAPAFPRNFGNRLRISRICDRLIDAGARVHFLHYPSEADWRHDLPMDSLHDHTRRFASFHLVPPTRPLHTGAEGTHHQRDEWWDPAIGSYLDWLTRVQRFDVGIVNYTWLSRALLHLPDSCLKVLDTHDRFSGRKELFIANGLEPEFFYLRTDEEAAALARADVVWAIKREEAVFFRAIAKKPVLTVPHIDPVVELPTTQGPFLRLGLIGANNNLNRENFETFLDAAVAHVRQHLTQVEIVVAGSVCKVLRPREEKFIRFLGYVDRVEDFYAAVDAVAVPMRFSTGLKIKTAEALSFGKPVLALEHAFEGFNPVHALHRLTSFSALMAAVDRLTRDPALLRDLAAASLVSAEASEREVAQGLAQTLELHEPLRRPTFWLVANGTELAAMPVLQDHLRESLAFFANVFPAVGVALAGPGRPGREFCAELAHYGPLAVLDDDPDGLDLAGMPARMIAVRPDSLLAHAIGAWVITRHGQPILDALPPGSGFAVFDALALSHACDPAGSDKGLIAALAGSGGGQTLCAGDLDFDGVPELIRAGWDVILLPWLKEGDQATLLQGLREARRQAERLTLRHAETGDGGRALIETRARAAQVLADQRQGRAQSVFVEGARWPAFLAEYLLRAGSPVTWQGASLTHADVEAALRHDAGWSAIWTRGRELAGRVAGSVETAVEPELPGPAAQAASPAPAASGPVTTPVSGPGPTMGFTRLTGADILSGDEVHFGQLMVYRPRGVAVDAVDVQMMNAWLADRGVNRLVLRFFFEPDRVDLSIRRNDCSPDAFLGPDAAWQEDAWGPFVIYKLGETLTSAYPRGLDAPDRAVLAEALNTIARVQDQARPRLEGEVLERWNRIVAVIGACDLVAPPAAIVPGLAE